MLEIETCPKEKSKKKQKKSTKICIDSEKCFTQNTEIIFALPEIKSIPYKPKKTICTCIGKSPDECRSKYCKNFRTNNF